MATKDHWQDTADHTHCIRVEFAGEDEAYTTLDHAADLLDFIDREKGMVDLLAGVKFRSAQGSFFEVASREAIGY